MADCWKVQVCVLCPVGAEEAQENVGSFSKGNRHRVVKKHLAEYKNTDPSLK